MKLHSHPSSGHVLYVTPEISLMDYKQVFYGFYVVMINAQDMGEHMPARAKPERGR
jgi:hypothetical protein